MARFWTLAAALTAGALTACTQSKSTPTTPPSASLALTPAATSVIADGTRTVRIDYLNTAGGTASLATSQGTFESSGASTVTTAAASGFETLRTCTFGAAGCTSGTTTVSITAGTATIAKSISFVSLAAACQTSCSSDASCNGLSCTLSGGGAGVCAAGTCTAGSACTPSPASATTETSCSDGIDNDCSGKRDCAETSCDGQPCKAGAPTFLCKSGACTDVTTGFSVTVTPARTRAPAVANVDVDIVVSVAAQADPAASVTVAVSLGDASLGSITPASAATNSKGVAHFTFRTSGTTGVETITATLAAVPTVTGTATVTIPRLASLRLLTGTPGSAQYSVMGAKGSGWQDLSWLKVAAVDDLGLPYPDGLPVRFEHRQLGAGSATSRSTLGLPLTADTATCVAASGCVGFQAVTASTGGAPDSAGVATAWIYSGTVAGTLPVTASASAGGASFSILLPTVTVVGAKASGTNFSVVCSPRNVPALAETDCAISLVNAPFTCEAIMKDRFDNVLGRSTQVVFASEAGSVGQIVSTPAYDPAGTAQTGLGLALQKFETLGNGLPFDVEPFASLGEPGVSHGRDGCGVRTHNPRDGVVTIIAVADGEEAFFDANGNGSYDVGEPFVDLGEPFIDQDDSGTWTPGEWFLDLDGNGTWTGPNTVWDANTKIWTQTYVVFTGASESWIPSGGQYMGTRIADDVVDACLSTTAPTPFDVFFESTTHAATTRSYDVVASDLNLNFPSTKAAYSAEVFPAGADLKPTYAGLASYADLTGMDWQFWPCANAGAGPCASQCRGPGACRMRPQFTGFSCGMSSSISVTGGSKAAAGALRFLVNVPWDRFGTSVTAHDQVEVSGSSHQ